MQNSGFLPISKQEMTDLGWFYCDFLLITGDSYVDHPSFGIAIIARMLEHLGFKVAILAQPQSAKEIAEMGKPRYATMITAGNIDSMVAHYSVSLKKRAVDDYTVGGKANRRPDRAATVYSLWTREVFGYDHNICLGGLEASLRRFAHYDYWSDSVKPSILVDSKADMLMFGMGERTITELANGLKTGEKLQELCKTIRGVAYLSKEIEIGDFKRAEVPSFKLVCENKKEYAKAAFLEEQNQDHAQGKAIIQRHDDVFLIQNPPSIPLETPEMDEVYALPFMRNYHPSYEQGGGVKSIEEVKHSIIHNRGCFGGCNFCALAFHQGRYISVRSHDSIIEEAKKITQDPDFKGYIHDVGGPSANFRQPSCKKQKDHGLCQDKRCMAPTLCKAADPDHKDYLKLLRKLREIKGIKKVFVRSGIRYDFLLAENDDEFMEDLVRHHISGQLKVAPEHMSDTVLDYMGKPSFKIYQQFRDKYTKMNEKIGKKQYLVPYLMSSHPGATVKDAIILAEHLNKMGYMPEQVQDFYPTPGTLSTAMYYTGIDPRTMKPVYVAKTREEKAMQRALLQWRKPDKRDIVKKALLSAGRADLIGFDKKCLIRPLKNEKPIEKPKSADKNSHTAKKNKFSDEQKRTGKNVRRYESRGRKTYVTDQKNEEYNRKNENKGRKTDSGRYDDKGYRSTEKSRNNDRKRGKK